MPVSFPEWTFLVRPGPSFPASRICHGVRQRLGRGGAPHKMTPPEPPLVTFALALIYSEVPSSGGSPSRFWAEKMALVGRDAPDPTRFGYSVAIEPSLRTAAAGAPSADRQYGWAFMFADLR